MKRTIAIIAAFLILGGLGTFIYLHRQQVPNYNMTRLLPTETAFFINVDDPVRFMDQLTNKSKIWDELEKMAPLEDLTHQVAYLDSMVNHEESLKNAFDNKKMIIAAQKQGQNRAGFTFLFNLQSKSHQNQLEGYLERWGRSGSRTVNTRTYNKVQLHSIENGKKQVLSYATTRGVLIASPSSLLVEQAIRQSFVENPLTTQKGFQKIRETAGKNVVANLYINFNRLPELMALPLASPFRDYIGEMADFAHWSALDINIKSDALLLNGFSKDHPQQSEILDLFANQEAVELEIASVLPSNTSTFISLGLSNKKDYRRQLHGLYREHETLDQYKAWVESIQSKHGFNPASQFYELFHQEVGLAFLHANVEQPREKAFILLKTKGQRIARNQLSRLSKKATPQDQPHRTQIKIDEQTQYPVYRLPIDHLFGRLFGSMFKGFGNEYFTILDNYVVFAHSTDMLKEFIYSNILNKTLNHNPQYKKFSEYLSHQANFHFYTNMYRSPQLIANFLRDDLKEGIDQNFQHFRKFQALAYQFMGGDQMCYNNLFIKYIPKIQEEPKTVWETHLDTATDFKPALVTNHHTGENDIFVQDLNNKIYLINNVGRILWKKQLDEPIMSQIYQIDYYRNGNLQMLFNTRHKMHLIDRNGNYVERYPIELPAPATAPMALFDYENNKDYRIMIPGNNKKIYDFYKDGDIVQGWEFDQTDTRVTQRVQHFRVDTRDYIAFADKYRIYILNRRGEVRVRPEEQFARSKNNLFKLEPETSRNPARLVTTDVQGRVRYVNFTGQVHTQKVNDYSSNHYFDYQDINSDGYKDFIFLDDNTLEVIEQDGNTLYSHSFEAPINDRPIHFYFAYNDRKIGVVSRQDNQIYLLNPSGQLYEGFPLKGSTPFSIGYLDEAGKDFHLIVGNKYNFLSNYNVIGK